MNSTDDPVPHDPWLREALRHAPDADAGPPARLSDTILRMGRAAVAPRPAPAPPRPPTLVERLLSAWGWLARPPVAAGFASVMVATVVGLMWWGRPIEEAMPPREEPAAIAQAPEPPPAAVPAPAPAPAETPRKEAASPKIPPAPPRVAIAPAPAPAPEPMQRKSAPPPPAAPPAAQRDSSAELAAPAPAEDGARLRGFAERRELATAAPAPSAAAPAGAGAAATADAAAQALPSALRSRAAVGTIETPGLSNLRFEIPRRQQEWTWQRDDGEARPVDDALMNWLAQADRTARPHWNPGTAGGEGAVATLRFTRGGVVRAILRIGPRGLRLDRGGKTESAELSAAQSAALISALDTLGP